MKVLIDFMTESAEQLKNAIEDSKEFNRYRISQYIEDSSMSFIEVNTCLNEKEVEKWLDNNRIDYIGVIER